MIENEQQEKRHRCKNCNSTFCYLRVKNNEWVCRSCGHVDNIDEVIS